MLNKVTLIGNLGAEPDIRYTADNTPVVNIRLATSRKWKDKKTGEQREHTEWHYIVFFNRLAEIAKNYISKGQQIYVEGRLQTNTWRDKDNHVRYSTEIVAEELKMLSKRNKISVLDEPIVSPTSSDYAVIDNFIDDIPF